RMLQETSFSHEWFPLTGEYAKKRQDECKHSACKNEAWELFAEAVHDHRGSQAEQRHLEPGAPGLPGQQPTKEHVPSVRYQQATQQYLVITAEELSDDWDQCADRQQHVDGGRYSVLVAE